MREQIERELAECSVKGITFGHREDQLRYLVGKLRQKETRIEQLEKALERIDNIAEVCGADAHIIRKIIQESRKEETP